MGHWRDIFSSKYDGYRRTPAEQLRRCEVSKVALKIKYQIEQVIPCELEDAALTSPNSRIITKDVVKTTMQAGGDDHRACVLFCLLICLRWFKTQAYSELWDAELHNCRALACEVIAKRIIETEEDQEFLVKEALLRRFSILVDGEETPPANVIERAVDFHALRVIGSSGYQKCINYLWRGWYCQQEGNPTCFVEYTRRSDTNYWHHFNPDRMRSPVYQIVCQMFFSLVYLALYTVVINTVNPSGDLDVVECILYAMTLAFICDEVSKLWKVGLNYFGFSNAFNSLLYAMLVASFVLRIVALSHSSTEHNEERHMFNELSYNFLAFAGPMFWMRMMLYLESIRFFGAMFVVVRVMMKESIIFFALLFVVFVGFFQAFIGMAQIDENVPVTRNIIQGMANTVMQSPDFEVFQDFAFPFGIILYYLFNFIVMLVLLNILIALYNSAYSDISNDATDEYMAIFAQKTMQFARPPDENVFVAPLNLIEIICLIIPFEWWLPRHLYAKLNDSVMTVLYSPLLFIVAWIETREACELKLRRRHGQEEDHEPQIWDKIADELGFEIDDTWKETVSEVKPNLQVDHCTMEVLHLRDQVRELTEIVKSLTQGGERSTQ